MRELDRCWRIGVLIMEFLTLLFLLFILANWPLRSKVKLGSSLCGLILEVNSHKELMMSCKKGKFTRVSDASLHTIPSPQFSSLAVNLAFSDVTFRTKEAF